MHSSTGRQNSREAFATFRSTLKAYGLRESLAYLLRLTDYRFIGLWRFQGGRADAVVHYDRENPAVLRAQEVVDTATYCCYVRDTRGAFMTENALLDPRTEGHVARTVVPAYCGVPVMDAEGEVLATLCHYDLVPRDPAQVDLELMVEVCGFLAQGRLVPPYPEPKPN